MTNDRIRDYWANFPKGRDGVLFLLGAAGILHEVVVTDGQRPYLLLALLAMAGFPVTQWIDKARQGGGGPGAPGGSNE